LILIGKASNYLPHFLVAFRNLGEMGLGARRSQYNLKSVIQFHPYSGQETPIFASGALSGSSGRAVTTHDIISHSERFSTDHLSVEFLTPTRLIDEDTLVKRIDFHVLARSLIRRISSIAYFYCGNRWETDYPGWAARSREVNLDQDESRWVDWERLSTRQEKKINLGGIVGKAEYSGKLMPFNALLAAGEILHVGKATTFGNGQMAVSV
jgi:hypothetical protein